METKITPVWMKAVILSLISIVYGLVLFFAGQSQNKGLGAVQYLIFVAGIIYFCIQFAKQQNGNVTFGNVFVHGFKITAAMAGILALWTILFIKVIAPEMVDMGMEEARKSMEAQNKMSDEQITQSLDMFRRYFMVIVVAGLLIVTMLCGVIASLIGAGVAKKNPNPTPFQ